MILKLLGGVPPESVWASLTARVSSIHRDPKLWSTEPNRIDCTESHESTKALCDFCGRGGCSCTPRESSHTIGGTRNTVREPLCYKMHREGSCHLANNGRDISQEVW